MHVAAAVGAPTVGIFPVSVGLPRALGAAGSADGGRARLLIRATRAIPRKPAATTPASRISTSRASSPRCDSLDRSDRARRFNSAPITAPRCSSAYSRPVSIRRCPTSYEVVLVDDGSSDATPAVIEAARGRATCRFTVVSQANAGLAPRATRGSRAPRGSGSSSSTTTCCRLPKFVAGASAFSRRRAARDRARRRPSKSKASTIFRRRSGAIRTTAAIFLDDATSPCRWRRFARSAASPRRSRSTAGKTSSWACACASRGTRAVFNPRALVYHYKPRPRASNVRRCCARPARKARTAVAAARDCTRTGASYLATGTTRCAGRCARDSRPPGSRAAARARSCESRDRDRALSSGG